MTGNRTLRQLLVLVVLFICLVVFVIYIKNRLGLNIPNSVIPLFLFPVLLGIAGFIKSRVN